MSRIYSQIQEITRFLLINKNVKDMDKLYERLVSHRKKKIPCFIERKDDLKQMRIRFEDISEGSFKRIVHFMAKISILGTEPVHLPPQNRKHLRKWSARKFDSWLEEIIKAYFAQYGIKISDIENKGIKRIKYPNLRDSRTIHSQMKESIKPKKIIGLRDFSKLLTLLGDIGVLERKSPTLFPGV